VDSSAFENGKLQEAIQLFDRIWRTRLSKVSFVLLLNKHDLLRNKILEDKARLEGMCQPSIFANFWPKNEHVSQKWKNFGEK